MIKQKFRLPYSGEKYGRATHFDEIVDEWQYSDELDRPVIVGKINIQEQIQQYADCALDKLLAKYMPETEIPKYLGDLVKNANYTDVDGVQDGEQPDYNNPAVISEILERAEQYRDDFGLSDDLSVSDIYKLVGSHAEKMKQKLDEKINKKSDSVPEEKKTEVKEDEKKKE